MPDVMDGVQDYAAAFTAEAERRHVERSRAPGRSECTGEDCGAPISPERQALGAVLCIECQRAAEAADAHRRVWGAR